ncbi:MAG: DUF445 domain-containing protein [Gammaproteobacteria bacterium]|nr:DUF445 domain-containing protein [Gammaproteobacteria bacterium]
MNSAEAALARRLAHMRWIATGLLFGMAVLFVAMSLLMSTHPWLGVIAAFAEAGMIGALADWFAVTALFRRPLGLPIPHTAIVPTRKNEIGQALAHFIRDHFLIKDAVLPRLSRADLAGRLGVWLAHEDNAHLVSRDLSRALAWLIGAVDSAELRQSLRESLRRALERGSVSAGLGVVLDVLTSGDHTQALVDQLVQIGRDQLRANEGRIRERIKDRSPWWLPRFVDEEVYDQLVGELQRILDDIGDDPEHSARADLNQRLRDLKTALNEDSLIAAKGQTLRDEFLRHPAVKAYLDDLWQRIRGYLSNALNDSGSPISVGLARELRSIGQKLQNDPEVSERLNRWLRELITYLVETYRQSLSEIVSDTIEKWDATATAERIELYIGRDLQFIRINGTLVGGLVGVLIYTVSGALPF